jgi:hypothetical protein
MSRSSSVGSLVFLMSCAMAGSSAGASTDYATVHPAVAAPFIVTVAASPFDGTYSGQVTNVKQATVCGSQNSWTATFVVQDNKFHTNIGKLLFAGDMHPDGSFESSVQLGRTGLIHLVGKINGIQLQANATGSLCEWTMNMSKAPS